MTENQDRFSHEPDASPDPAEEMSDEARLTGSHDIEPSSSDAIDPWASPPAASPASPAAPSFPAPPSSSTPPPSTPPSTPAPAAPSAPQPSEPVNPWAAPSSAAANTPPTPPSAQDRSEAPIQPPSPPAPGAAAQPPAAAVPPPTWASPSEPAPPAPSQPGTPSWQQPEPPNQSPSPSPSQWQQPQGTPPGPQPQQPPAAQQQWNAAPPAQQPAPPQQQWPPAQQPQQFQQPQQPPQFQQPQQPYQGQPSAPPQGQYQYAPQAYQHQQPYQGQPGQVPPPGWLGAPPAGTPTAAPAKSGKGWLIGGLAVLAFLVLGGIGLFVLGSDDGGETATNSDDGEILVNPGPDEDSTTDDTDDDSTDDSTTDDEGIGDDDDDPEPFEPQVPLTIDATIADLQDYWADEFPAEFGAEYIPLDDDAVFPLSSVNSLSCGNEDIPIELLRGNAIYCPPDDYITWDDEDLFPGLERQFGELAPALVMAHEWGHAIQSRIGMDETRIPTVLIELQADCFAGAWANSLLSRTEGIRIEVADLDSAVAGLLQFADPIQVSAGAPGAHGSGFDRVTAFADGVEGGSAACADYLDGGIEPIDIDLGGLGDDGTGNLPFLDIDGAGTTAPDLFLRDLQIFFDGEAAEIGEEVREVTDISRRRDTGGIVCDEPTDGALVTVCPSDDGERAGLVWSDDLIQLHRDIGDFGSALVISIEVSRLHAPTFGLEGNPAQLDCLAGAWTGFASEPQEERFPPGITPEEEEIQLQRLILSPGDLDEAIVGMLEAQEMDRTVFERVRSFEDGFFGGLDACPDQQ